MYRGEMSPRVDGFSVSAHSPATDVSDYSKMPIVVPV